jgi:amino acid transporter
MEGVGMPLARKLGLIEAVSLSLAVLAPTMAMAFNVSLAAQAAGPAAPLAFAVGTVVLATVGLSFVAFSRRMAYAGSAYAFLADSFGPRSGFIAGWLLLLNYMSFGSATAALAGSFVTAALGNYGAAMPGVWLACAILALLAAMLCAYRDMAIAARLMLALEAVSVLAILVLAVMILVQVAGAGGLSLVPFRPAAQAGGWSGIGFALVYAILSFAGFEGATTLGEEMRAPYRDIPRAVLGTVVIAGAFFVFVSYAQVVGFGVDDVGELTASAAPLNSLAMRFASRELATAIDLAAATSAFSCSLGSLSAASRMLFALGRGTGIPILARVHAVHGTPGPAVVAVGAIMLATLILWAPWTGAENYYGYVGTIGTLALILVYLAVTVGGARAAKHRSAALWCAAGVAGTVLLLWPLGNSLYPVPAHPYDLFPYVVLAWIAAGLGLVMLRPLRPEPLMARPDIP